MGKARDEHIFSFILLAILGVIIVMSFSYNAKAQAFPLYSALLAFIMVFLQTITRMMKNPPKYLQFINKRGALGNESNTETASATEKEELPWVKVGIVFMWLIFYALLIWFVHYIIATLIFTILLLHFAGKVKWLTNLIFSVVLSSSLYVLFELILRNQ